MVRLNACRNLYPSWKSTKRYLNKLEGIAFFPEESLDFGKDWSRQTVVEYSSGKNLWFIGSVGNSEQSIVTIHDGVLEKYEAEPEPININGISVLTRICADSLKPSPQYSTLSDIIFISSAISFDHDQIIQLHRHNLVDDPYFVLACYGIHRCEIAREGRPNLGEVVRKSADSYLKYDFVK
jgi:hypothetical protein